MAQHTAWFAGAAHIVHCVNMHPDLMRDIRSLLELFEHVDRIEDDDGNSVFGDLAERTQPLRAALAAEEAYQKELSLSPRS